MADHEFVKTLRRNMTDAERLLWRHLRGHRLGGVKFRRQQPIGRYVVDFVNFEARLVVEADGGQHNDSRADMRRDAWLNGQGFRVMRFWNADILNDTGAVLEAIVAAVGNAVPLTPGPSPARGEGSQAGSLTALPILPAPSPQEGGEVAKGNLPRVTEGNAHGVRESLVRLSR